MDKFDELVDQHLLEEGILSRAGERIKNVGRNISHPLTRAFGNSEKNVDAMSTTRKGYKKQRMLKSLLTDTANDLIKLGVSTGSIKDLVSAMADGLSDAELVSWEEDDFSEFGKKFAQNKQDRERLDSERASWDSRKEYELDRERARAEREQSSTPGASGATRVPLTTTSQFKVDDNVKVKTRSGKILGGTVKAINPNGTYLVQVTINGNRRTTMSYKPDQLEKI